MGIMILFSEFDSYRVIYTTGLVLKSVEHKKNVDQQQNIWQFWYCVYKQREKIQNIQNIY